MATPTCNRRIASRVLLLLVFCLPLHAARAQVQVQVEDAEIGPWLSRQATVSQQAMLGNIGSNGAVIASPSTSPDYRYHWVRDGALTMDAVVDLYRRASDRGDRGEREGLMDLLLTYADFSRRNQLTSNRSGEADGLGLGEPKFMLDGSAYDAPWGRPQNDGAALRASTLCHWAELLLSQGQGALVRQKLYDPTLPARTVIKADLEFVANHWRDSSFDLWEEVRGTHFYTRMVQRRALLDGAALALRMGDGAAAGWYLQQAHELEAQLARHWNAARRQIDVTLDRVEGLGYKSSGLDVAVALGVLHGAARQGADAFFGLTDERVLATLKKIDAAFRSLYPINGEEHDPASGAPIGTAIGRYPEDRYDGVSGNGQGSPWFLATAAFAEVLYRQAHELRERGSVTLTALSSAYYRKFVSSRQGWVAGTTLYEGDARFEALIQGLKDAGDAYLRRVRLHTPASGVLAEQFNRDNGFMQSAENLTWSHASLLTAAWAREGL